MAKKDRRRITLAHIVTVVVLTLWAASMILDAVVPTYDPPESLSIALMAIIGPLVGTLLVRRDRDDSDEGDE